jgi:hypothetical protein
VCAYPYGLDGREDMILEFEVRDKVRFRIAEELGSSPEGDGLEARVDAARSPAVSPVQ